MKDNTSKLIAESYLEVKNYKPALFRTLDYIVLDNINEDISQTGSSSPLNQLVHPLVSKIVAGLDTQTKQRIAMAARNPATLQDELDKIASEGEVEAQNDLQKMEKDSAATGGAAVAGAQGVQAKTVAKDPAASVAGVPGTPGQTPGIVNSSTKITLGDYVKVYENYIRELQYSINDKQFRNKLEEAFINLKKYTEGKEAEEIFEEVEQGDSTKNFEKVKTWFASPGNNKRGKAGLGLLKNLFGSAIIPIVTAPIVASMYNK